jgi:hypothetical protein
MNELALLLVGATIALVSGLIGAWVQHTLSHREDRIKRDRDREEKEQGSARAQLLAGVGEGIDKEIEKEMEARDWGYDLSAPTMDASDLHTALLADLSVDDGSIISSEEDADVTRLRRGPEEDQDRPPD